MQEKGKRKYNFINLLSNEMIDTCEGHMKNNFLAHSNETNIIILAIITTLLVVFCYTKSYYFLDKMKMI